jgi:hypothetical protein
MTAAEAAQLPAKQRSTSVARSKVHVRMRVSTISTVVGRGVTSDDSRCHNAAEAAGFEHQQLEGEMRKRRDERQKRRA